MSAATRRKRAIKEATRLPSRYEDPTEIKPREYLWIRYKKTGLKYDPMEYSSKNFRSKGLSEKPTSQSVAMTILDDPETARDHDHSCCDHKHD